MSQSLMDMECQSQPEADEPSVPLPDGFDIRDEASAVWLVRKIVEARAHAERVRAWAAAEVLRAERDEGWLLGRFGAAIESWLLLELDRAGGRRRSLRLPDGTIGFRRQPVHLIVTDELQAARWSARHLPGALRIIVEAEGQDAIDLAKWHRERPDASRQRQQVLRAPLMRHLEDTGEVPEGTVPRPASDVFYVK